MARKDVELVIRAKNDASKTVEAINSAFDTLKDLLGQVTGAGGKTDSMLGRLSAALTDLDKSTKGSGINSIADQMSKATAAAGRLEAELAQVGAEAKQFAADSAAAAAQTAKLRAESEALAASMKAQQAAVEKAGAAQKALNQKIAEATNARSSLVAADARVAEQIEKQEVAVAGATEKYAKLSAQLEATAKPTKTFQEKVEAARVSLEKKQAKLTDMVAAYAANRNELDKTNATLAGYAAKSAESVVAVEKLKAGLAGTAKEFDAIRTAVKSAAENQKTLESAVEGSTAALTRVQGQYDKAQAELGQIAVAAKQAGTAMEELASAAAVAELKGFESLRRSMLETKKAWASAEADVKSLAAAIKSTDAPSAQMVADFDRSKIAAKAAKEEYLAQRNALNELSTVLKSTATDLNGLMTNQQRFAAVQGNLANAIGQIRQRAAASGQALEQSAAAAARAARASSDVANKARDAGNGMGEGAGGTNRFAEALRQLYGESRTAMSWTQRLRGEVLSLIAAYGGIFGAIEGVRQIVKAYQTLEAAQSRLNAVFKGDQKQVGVELDFIRRNADRLGIEFGTLAEQYGKFAAATQGTNLAGQKTRDIFISVAEAARVNKLSNEQIVGTLTALGQIASKGKVQLEELSQQLGDRLPGALQIMAEGLGISTAKLLEMTAKGELTSEALVGFAEALTKRYGSSLPAALQTTTTALGQFQNAVFQTFLRIGEAGAINGFTKFIQSLTDTFKSADAIGFFQRLGSAIGTLFGVLQALTENWRLLTAAVSAYLAVKITGALVALFPVLTKTGAELLAVRAAANAAAASTTATAASMTAAAPAAITLASVMTRLKTVLLSLTASTGIGLLLVGVSVAMSAWATSADKATSALVEHGKVVDEIKNAYDKAKGSAEKFADAVKGISKTQSEARLQTFREEIARVTKELEETVNRASSGKGRFSFADGARKIIEDFKAARISAEELKKRMDDLAQATGVDKKWAAGVLETIDALKKAQSAADAEEKALKSLNGTTDEAIKAAGELTGAAKVVGDALGTSATDGAKKFQDALEEIAKFVPTLNAELKKMKDLANIDASFKTILDQGPPTREVNDAVNAARGSVGLEAATAALGAQAGDFEKASAALIMKFEGFQKEAFWDVNAWRMGWSSHFADRFGGRRVQQGDTTTTDEANRVLAGWIQSLKATIVKQIGPERLNQFTPMQQGVLTSIAYNYGSLPGRITRPINAGASNEEIAAAIRSLGVDNGGIRTGRRNEEAAIFAGQNSGAAALKQAEAQFKLNQGIEETITKTKQLAEIERLKNEGKGREAAVQAAIQAEEAKFAQENLKLGDEQKIRIRAVTEALYDQQNVKKQATAANKEIAQQERIVNDLVAARTSLLARIKTAQTAGDQGAVTSLTGQLATVNTELTAARDKAIEMWRAIGGPEADSSIAKLNAMATTVKTAGAQSWIQWKEVGELFAGQVATGFDNFVSLVQQGTSVGEAARQAFLQFASDFLRQLAQMIIKQAVLNALRAFMPSLFGTATVAHGGGIIGSLNRTRAVDPGVFAGAARYHSGGIAGLKPNEVPAVLKRNEEVLTTSDPRHRFNGGGMGGGGTVKGGDTKIVNAFDTSSFLEESLKTRTGERAILNFVRANPGAFKAAMGG
jgi:tape measure domain-containing protein